eukprot:763466-Hanusia_phi.AAC.1
MGRGREGQLGRGDIVESPVAYRSAPLQVTSFAHDRIRVRDPSSASRCLLTPPPPSSPPPPPPPPRSPPRSPPPSLPPPPPPPPRCIKSHAAQVIR